jgi:hypothetical protein
MPLDYIERLDDNLYQLGFGSMGSMNVTLGDGEPSARRINGDDLDDDTRDLYLMDLQEGIPSDTEHRDHALRVLRAYEFDVPDGIIEPEGAWQFTPGWGEELRQAFMKKPQKGNLTANQIKLLGMAGLDVQRTGRGVLHIVDSSGDTLVTMRNLSRDMYGVAKKIIAQVR